MGSPVFPGHVSPVEKIIEQKRNALACTFTPDGFTSTTSRSTNRIRPAQEKMPYPLLITWNYHPNS